MRNTISSYKNKSTSSRSSRSSRSSNKNNKENPQKHVDEFRVSTQKVMIENSKRKLRIRHKLKELLARPLRDGATQREKEINHKEFVLFRGCSCRDGKSLLVD